MVRRSHPGRRRGALMVESAVVYPLFFVLLFGLVVGGMGVFRYQQVACQAHEAARYACVRGSQWAQQTGKTSPTSAEIYQSAVVPVAAGMDTTKLSIRVQWIDESTGTATDWDQAGKWPTSTTGSGDQVTNRVRVTVTYRWSPEFFFLGAITLTGVSEIPMAY